jgi:hypothetical protein
LVASTLLKSKAALAEFFLAGFCSVPVALC